MPEYLVSYENNLQNERSRIPATFGHMRQFLSYVPDQQWSYVQSVAQQSLEGKLTHSHKIKPSSWKKLATQSGFQNIKHLTQEYVGHNNPSSDVHMGGGIHEAIQTALQVVGGWLGGKRINEWFAGEKEIKQLSHYERDMAKLLQATYQKDRPETMGGYTRMDDYDSEYGSIWRGPTGKYVLSVRGSALSWKDIFSDIKIAGGSGSQSDDALVETLRSFNTAHPDNKLSVAAHSLGTMLAYNGLEATKSNVDDLYLFNPASSPFQDKQIVRDVVENTSYNTKYYLNTGDVVSNYFGQLMTPQEISSSVSYGRYAKSPLASHGLAQWVEEY
jgi:hypothetical protein